MPVTIEIRDIPEHLHDQLRAYAARAGKSLPDYLRELLCEIAERPTRNALRERLNRLPRVMPLISAEDAVRAERNNR